MTQYWGAFTKQGRPSVRGQEHWPQADDGSVLSLRAGGDTTVIDHATYTAEHRCAFWTTMPRLDTTA